METKNQIISLPIAIVVAGIVIAMAIVYVWQGKKVAVADGENLAATSVATPLPIMPLSPSDHYQGDPQAQIVIVEFSDTECPFCQRMHDTMKQLLADEAGKVAWVYRHAPIEALHTRSFKEAEALECAAEVGGEDGFWNYLDALFVATPTNDGLDPAELPVIAESIKLKRSKFEVCLNSGKMAERVNENLNDALAAGPGSTPWSVVMTRDGKVQYPMNGAMPLSVIKQLVKAATARAGVVR